MTCWGAGEVGRKKRGVGFSEAFSSSKGLPSGSSSCSRRTSDGPNEWAFKIERTENREANEVGVDGPDVLTISALTDPITCRTTPPCVGVTITAASLSNSLAKLMFERFECLDDDAPEMPDIWDSAFWEILTHPVPRSTSGVRAGRAGVVKGWFSDAPRVEVEARVDMELGGTKRMGMTLKLSVPVESMV